MEINERTDLYIWVVHISCFMVGQEIRPRLDRISVIGFRYIFLFSVDSGTDI